MRLEVQAVLTPIFNKEIGYRMQIIRQKMLKDQAELGRLFGVSQQVISRLERGAMATAKTPFTLARFNAIFGTHAGFILLGSQAEKYSRGHIRQKYWETKNKRLGADHEA